MNFFKSVFVDDEPDPSDLRSPNSSSPKSPHQHPDEHDEQQEEPIFNPSPKSASEAPIWSFGGLMKTFATKSETVIQTYRRDLEEFGTGLKKETATIREAASRVVKELPASIEVAQGSIESVIRGTAEIISQSKDTILSPDPDSDSSDTQYFRNSKPFNRFEKQISVIQNDLSTYCEDPEDLEDFGKWKLGFVVDEKGEEIENLLEENGVMDGIYAKVVPSVVDHETFWWRYFYRVYKLQQVEDARANLVKRAISGADEDLSWDVDDDDNTDNVVNSSEKKESPKSPESPKPVMEEKHIRIEEPKSVDRELVSKIPVEESGSDDKKVSLEEKPDVSEEAVVKSDTKELETGKVETAELSKESEVSVASTKPPESEEEDLGWDEIEDVGSGDEKKVAGGVSTDRTELRKRLSVAEEDEDLNWDIEDDDDEPVKH